MAKFRNISGRDLAVAVGGGFVNVASDEVIDLPDAYCAEFYVQTGEQGEPALFEPVAAAKPKTPKTD